MDIRSRHKWWDLQVVKPDAASMAKRGQPPARSFTIGMDANSVDKLSSGPLASLLHREKSNMLTYFIRIFQETFSVQHSLVNCKLTF
jgi:hypothetical protein